MCTKNTDNDSRRYFGLFTIPTKIHNLFFLVIQGSTVIQLRSILDEKETHSMSFPCSIKFRTRISLLLTTVPMTATFKVLIDLESNEWFIQYHPKIQTSSP